MTNASLKIHIRLALHDLGRDAHQKLPRQKAALKAMLSILRIEQANSKTSKLSDDIKASVLARMAS